jgi:RNA polymerase sigma-70 factor (ECF subfamily)
VTNQNLSIEKIINGDAGEFERMFHSHYKRLCVYAESIIGNSFEAEEIVCNMFVRLWEKRGQLQIQTSVESYIVASIHHDSLNYLKHVKVEEKYYEMAQYQLTHTDLLSPSGSETPLTDMLTKELGDHIESAIRSLPPQCREVFVLHKMEGLTYEEVAQKLGVSINTVRTQITRAMKKMRIALARFL